MVRVLDAHGLLVFLEKEAGYGKVEQSFAAALARLHKGEIITGDKEFKTVES